jgi:energy-coupling factor transporter transmembrane protein EcfT
LALVFMSAAIGLSGPYALLPWLFIIPVLYAAGGLKLIDLIAGIRPVLLFAVGMGMLGSLSLPFSWAALAQRAPMAFLAALKLILISSIANLFYISTSVGEIADLLEGPPERHRSLKTVGLTLGLALCYLPRLHSMMTEMESAMAIRLGRKGRFERARTLYAALLPRALDMGDLYADALEARAYSSHRRPRARPIRAIELAAVLMAGACSIAWACIL